jgi:hypothetical protein
MLPTEVDAYMNDLLEKGAYRVDGIDPDTGELLLSIVPEIMAVVDPELLEIYELQAGLEFEQTMFSLEEKGLVTRLDDDEFTLTDTAIQALSE